LAKELKQFYKNLTGDILVSSGLIAYLGAFTSAFHSRILTGSPKVACKLYVSDDGIFLVIHSATHY
jgi:hypothetical protein